MGGVIDPPPTPWREAVVHLRDGPRLTCKTKEDNSLVHPNMNSHFSPRSGYPLGRGIDRDLLPELWVELEDSEGRKGQSRSKKILNKIPAVNETSERVNGIVFLSVKRLPNSR